MAEISLPFEIFGRDWRMGIGCGGALVASRSHIEVEQLSVTSEDKHLKIDK